MAVNLSTATANNFLNTLRGTAYGTGVTTFVQLHTANPGTAGTTSVSSVTTRPSITFTASTTGVLASSNTPSWASWAGTNGEVITHVSLWDASTAGNFLASFALTASKTVNTGDTVNLTSLSITIPTAS